MMVGMGRGRVLVVDDEPMVLEVLGRYLERSGFSVDQAADGQEALDCFSTSSPDLILLDLMLPRINGYEVFRRVREASSTPVIMLTARGDETDRIVGLELGADDYVTKPFSPGEVVARVRSVLRRSAPDVGVEPSSTLEFGNLSIDLNRREARVNDSVVHLTRKEFDLLAYLVARPGVTFSRSHLLENIWDFAWLGDPSTVTVHIRRLRAKIEVDPASPRHLLTVWGVGYRFEE